MNRLMNGLMDGMMDEGKRADFVQAKSELVFHQILAVDPNLHAISKRNEIEG